MLFLTRQPSRNGATAIGIRLETPKRGYQVASVLGTAPAETEALARLFIQAPLADQLVREAIAILANEEELDIRDWLRSAHAYVDTVDGKD